MHEASLTRRLLAYGGFTALSVIILIWGLRLDCCNLGVPLAYQGDVLLILPLARTMIETGTHWTMHRLGAPGIQELHDYPIVDHLHFGILWLLGQFTPTYVHAYNLYYLATYPLTVLTTMMVLRAFGVSFASAGLAGMLYAFLPYHAIRGVGHYFLSAYWTMPLSLWPAIMILLDRRLFFDNDKFTLKSRVGITAILVGLLTSAAGAYYAFFACAAIAFSGVYTAIASKNWRPLVCAMLATSAIVAGGIAQHLPTVVYQMKNGANPVPTARGPEDAERYGLKLPQVLLPVQNHQWKVLSDVRSRYDSVFRDCQNENETATMGIVGSATFLVLLARALLPLPRVSPWSPLSALVLFLTLFAIIGGLGAVFNFVVFPAVRSLNRFSVAISFLCFFALAIQLDRLTNRVWLRRILVVGLLVLGIYDESPRPWFREAMADRSAVEREWQMDADTFRRIEEKVPGSILFCWPYMVYPEGSDLHDLDAYQHVRGFLHSQTLRFSFGAMKQRENDLWQKQFSDPKIANGTRKPWTTTEIVEKLVLRGFDGIIVEKRGYPTAAAAEAFLQSLREITGSTPQAEIADDLRVFVDFRPFRERWKQSLGSAEYARREQAEQFAIRMVWLAGFEMGGSDFHRWCSPRGVAEIINPSDVPRRVRVRMVIRSSTPTAGELKIDGGTVWTESMRISEASPLIEREWTVPPGRTKLRFDYAPTREHVPKDGRNHAFFIGYLEIVEIE